ncbi:MAG: HAD hydrolase-like protein [Nocardia sp.]|nr:HAD hydrolase-like protein [Nocardia sp.]
MDLTNLVALGTNVPASRLMEVARTTIADTAHALARRGTSPHYLRASAGIRTHATTVDRIALREPLYDPYRLYPADSGPDSVLAGVGNPAADRRLSRLLDRRLCMIFDVDGPICSVFAGLPDYVVAARMRASLDLPYPSSIATANDPFKVLRYAAGFGDEWGRKAERLLSELEVEAMGSARPTPGAADLLGANRARGGINLMLSNNCVAAVDRYHQRKGTQHLVHGNYSRGAVAAYAHRISALKPAEFAFERAMADKGVSPNECIYIGDSTTDIEGAHRAGMPVIAFADKPGKIEAFAPFEPDVIVTEMAAVQRAMSSRA